VYEINPSINVCGNTDMARKAQDGRRIISNIGDDRGNGFVIDRDSNLIRQDLTSCQQCLVTVEAIAGDGGKSTKPSQVIGFLSYGMFKREAKQKKLIQSLSIFLLTQPRLGKI
jgi:hypothetical protein